MSSECRSIFSESFPLLLGRLSLHAKGVWMDGDLNKYDLHHRVTHHARMSDAEWETAYAEAWHAYYTPQHIETVIRRAAALPGGRPRAKMRLMLWFYLMYRIEGLHPRRPVHQIPQDRRPDQPIEHPLVFYPKYAVGIARKAGQYAAMVRTAYRLLRRVERDPHAAAYRDLAITPPASDELETLAMFHETSGGEAAVAKKRREDELRTKVAHLPGRRIEVGALQA
jgi:hypothetical protein